MAGTDVFFSYSGPVNHQQVDKLLIQLRQTAKFRELQKITGKRVYSVMAECLDNILRHSAGREQNDSIYQPFVSVGEEEGSIIITSGNLVYEEKAGSINHCLEKLNSLSKGELIDLYEANLDKGMADGTNGSGLGCILMRIKSEHNISYSLKKAYNNMLYFELRISINKYHEKVNY